MIKFLKNKIYIIQLILLLIISSVFFCAINLISKGNLKTFDQVNNQNINKLLSENQFTLKQVSLGSKHSAVIVNDGTQDKLYTWGDNAWGELGFGNQSSSSEPKEVEFFSDASKFKEIKEISLGTDFSSAIVNDGTQDKLYTWGKNAHGQLGIDNDKMQKLPQEVTYFSGDSKIKEISLGNNFALAVANDGTEDKIYSWGSNAVGQLGLGDSAGRGDQWLPLEVKNLSSFNKIKQIQASNLFSGAIVNNGSKDELYMWGANNYCQLGLGDSEDKVSPQNVTTLSSFDSIEQISLGYYNSSAIVNDGTQEKLYVWGDSSISESIPKSGDKITLPEELTFFSDVSKFKKIKQVALGFQSYSVIVNDGSKDKLFIWGNNESGQLGFGDNKNRDVPEELTFFSSYNEIKQFCFGEKFSSIIIVDNSNNYQLLTWGYNYYNQLGLGDHEDRNEPNLVPLGPIYVNTIEYLNSSLTINDNSISFNLNLFSSLYDEATLPEDYKLVFMANNEIIEDNIKPILGEDEYTINDLDYGKTYFNSTINLVDGSGNIISSTIIDDGDIKIEGEECQITNVSTEVNYDNFYITFDITSGDSGTLKPYIILLQIKKEDSDIWEDGTSYKPTTDAPYEVNNVFLQKENIKEEGDYEYRLINTLDNVSLSSGEFNINKKTDPIVVNGSSSSITYSSALITFDIDSKDHSDLINEYSMQVQVSELDKDDWQNKGDPVNGSHIQEGVSVQVDDLNYNTQYKYQIINTKSETPISLFQGEFLTSDIGVNVSIENGVSTRVKYSQMFVTFDLEYKDLQEDSKLLDFDIYLQYSLDGASWKNSDEHFQSSDWPSASKDDNKKTGIVLHINGLSQLNKYKWRLVDTKHYTTETISGNIFIPLNPIYWIIIVIIIISISFIAIFIFTILFIKLKRAIKKEKDFAQKSGWY